MFISFLIYNVILVSVSKVLPFKCYYLLIAQQSTVHEHNDNIGYPEEGTISKSFNSWSFLSIVPRTLFGFSATPLHLMFWHISIVVHIFSSTKVTLLIVHLFSHSSLILALDCQTLNSWLKTPMPLWLTG